MSDSIIHSDSTCSLRVDLKIIEENYKTLLRKCDNAEVGASIKANAYGLGADRIAPILKHSGCNHFFVSSCDEGISLRKILGPEADIYVLKGIFRSELEYFTEHNLTPVLNDLWQIELWQKYAFSLSKKLPCFVHIDTGMYRLGIPPSEVINLLNHDDISNLDIRCIMSHLTSSEDSSSPSNQEQLALFNKYSSKFDKAKRSLANSSGIFLGKEYHFDLTRAGAAIYGINPTPYLKESPVKNPIELTAPIIAIRDLPQLGSVGYNGTFTNKYDHARTIATIPIGYADGFPRISSNKVSLHIDGIEAPVIGLISMDLTIIDVSNIPYTKLFLGQRVEILGENSTPDKLAKLCSTNSYEILTMLGYRHKKIYSTL
jgi:alanine racemase